MDLELIDEDPPLPVLVGSTLVIAGALLNAVGSFHPVGSSALAGFHSVLPNVVGVGLSLGLVSFGASAVLRPEWTQVAGIAAIVLAFASAGGGPIGGIALGAMIAVLGGALLLISAFI